MHDKHYDVHSDIIHTRPIRSALKETDETWTVEKPLYDIRHDAYWLVTKSRHGYRFTGPIALSVAVLDLLPQMTENERRAAMAHMPHNDAPFGIEVEYREEHNDGA